jgi:hypothetical protein
LQRRETEDDPAREHDSGLRMRLSIAAPLLTQLFATYYVKEEDRHANDDVPARVAKEFTQRKHAKRICYESSEDPMGRPG